MTTTTTKPSFDPIKLGCWIGIVAYVVNKALRLQQGATLREVFDFGDPSLWGLMVGACVVGLILRSPKIRRSATLIETNETRAVTWSFTTVFTVMAAYYFLRPVRDSMASDWSQAEISQLWTIQFFLSLALVMVYGFACSRIRFRLLVPAMYTFYAVTFALFFGSSLVTDRVLSTRASTSGSAYSACFICPYSGASWPIRSASSSRNVCSHSSPPARALAPPPVRSSSPSSSAMSATTTSC
jgi:hypothetical protein